MEAIADLADRFGFGKVVVTHTQNLVLPDVRSTDLEAVHAELQRIGLAEANFERVTDIIACPGLDFCNLANARSIPVAQEIAEDIGDPEELAELGEVSIKISGCINACGHHHVGNIGILGINKSGEEYYQLMLGGSAADDASLGKILGPAFPRDEIVGAVRRVLETYLAQRSSEDERFIDCLRRIGDEPFKENVYVD